MTNVNRRRFLQTSLGASAAAAAGSGRSQAQTAGRPNIVIVLTDNQGREAGCYGNRVIRTPHMDALAADGVVMADAFCTTSSCSPSRAVILSGLYGHANGMYGLSHAYHHFSSFDHVQSLPVLLGKAGYRTCRVGKLHVTPDSVFRFDVSVEADSRNGVQMAEHARPFLESAGRQPFFLYFCPYDPHRDRPFMTWPEPNRFANLPEGYPGVKTEIYDPKDVVVPPFLTDTPETRAELAEYYQSISRADQGLGRLVQILKETGHYENSVIFFLSDNGSAFPGALATLYEPGMHLPLIVRYPNATRRGKSCTAMVNWPCITPTALDFAGALENPSQFQGRSFRSALEEENPAGWDEAYASHTFHEVTMYHPMRVVRGRRYKLIWNLAWEQEQPIPRDIRESSTWQSLIRGGHQQLGKRTLQAFLRRPRFELYDLHADPHEIHNLAAEPAHARLLEESKAKLRAFQERTQDPWVIAWEDHQGLHVVEKH